jgi:1-deoxy-D-xylulose-5-phosphate reductoisomerase
LARRIVILGATGSIGDSTFKVIEALEGEYEVVGLAVGHRLDKAVALARRWGVKILSIADEVDIPTVRKLLPGIKIVAGAQGLLQVASLPECDLVLNALVGAVGLEPTLAAIDAGKQVAMANKEPLVMAGGLILERARKAGVDILPLDSEPNAMWQCLRGEDKGQVKRLILTASGGAFRDMDPNDMASVTPEQALHHPTWDMGAKITVDSATLMNKGFEVIEAAWLFGVPPTQVDVVIHRQSVVHSLVEYVDGSILAHLGKTDMVLPIQYALTFPQRKKAPLEGLDLAALGRLDFAAPDLERYPALELCYLAADLGGGVPAALNAANEEAVAAFLAGRIGFLDIVALNQSVVEASRELVDASTVEAVLEADAHGRGLAHDWVAGRQSA